MLRCAALRFWLLLTRQPHAQIGKKKFKNQTQVFQNSNCPAWNETFEFHPVLSNSDDFRWLMVEVFDMSSGKPRDMGYFKLDLKALTLNQKVKGWFKYVTSRYFDLVIDVCCHLSC